MKTDADRLVEFILDRTPTISKRGESVSFDFTDCDEACEFYEVVAEILRGGVDCSDIPEITGPLIPARLRRDAEGRLLPRAQAAINVRDYIAALPEDEREEIERLIREKRSTST